MSGLPEGWSIQSIDELCSLNPKYEPEAIEPKEVSFIPMPAVSEISGSIVENRARPFKEVKKGYTHFENGDVIFAKITPCMENGKAAIASNLINGIARGSTEFYVLRGKGAIDPKFLHRYLRQESFRKNARHNMTGAVGHARVPKNYLLSQELPLPPANEQKRIVKKLETCEARIEAAREALSETPKLLEDYRQSVLAAAFRGDLTAKWRTQHPEVESAEKLLERLRHERRQRWEQVELEKYEAKGKAPPKDWKKKYKAPKPLTKAQIDELPELPEGWCWAKCEEVTSALRYGSSAKSKKAGKIPVLRMGNIQDGEIDWDSLVYTSDSDEIEKYKLPEQAVLFNRTNSPDLVGKTSIYRGNPRAIFAGYLIHVETLESYLPEFINLVLNSPRAKDWCLEVKSDGVSQSNISASKLAEFPVPICPVSEQSELVTATYRALNLRKSLQSYNNQTTADLTSLTQSLLAKAFNGELVPQDPNDEPASKLLEQIAEERQLKANTKVASKSKKRKTSKPAFTNLKITV